MSLYIEENGVLIEEEDVEICCFQCPQIGDFIVLLIQWHHDPIISTHSYYCNTDQTCPYPILLMPSARLGSDKRQFSKSFVLTLLGVNSQYSAVNTGSQPKLLKFSHSVRAES